MKRSSGRRPINAFIFYNFFLENRFVKCRLDQVTLRTKTVKNAITAEFGEEFLFKWAGIRSLCIENMFAFVVIYSRSLLTLQ